MKALSLFLGLWAVLVSGQSATFEIPSEYTTWDQQSWTLSTNKLIQGQYQSRLNLANGYLGCAQSAVGPFFEADRNLTNPDGKPPIIGWPLDSPRQTFCSIAGFWDSQVNTTRTNFAWLLHNGGESVISGVPHWGGIIFEFNGAHLDATVDNTTVSGFKSSLSAKEGVAKWSFRWSPSTTDGVTFIITYTVILSRNRPNLAAVRADIIASDDYNGAVTDLLDGRSTVRSTPVGKGLDPNTSTIYSAVSPRGLDNITAYIVSVTSSSSPGVDLNSRKLADAPWLPKSDSTIGQTYTLGLKKGEQASIFKFVGGASADAFADPQKTARDAASTAQAMGWDAVLAEHVSAWANVLPATSIDDYTGSDGKLPDDPYINDLQISSVMTPFYLLQQTLNGTAGPGLGDNSITVGGLSSDVYAGFVFWDADIFMSPGLVVANPEYARTIANYRIAKSGQARANAVANGFSNGSVLYPWTSGRFGNCTATGPCTDYQYHINSDIAQMLLQHRNVTGDERWWREQAWPVYDGVALMFSELLKYNTTTEQYDIYNMTDPDEYANAIDNGAYTLASASKVLRTANTFRALYGMPVKETWTKIADHVAIPYDPSGITTEYDGMNNSVPIKQADVVLNTYPLDYTSNYTESQSLNDLDYYANKQSPDGPAMTYSILSIVANTVSLSGCSAYTYALGAFQPYTRAPWYQFSEQVIDNFTTNGGTNPAFPFLTGHGGFHQIGPYGWLGLRTDGPILLIDPALPPQIPLVKLRTFYYGGATINARINATHTTLTRIQTTNTFVHDLYGNNPMPLAVGARTRTQYNLTIGGSLTIANRQYSQNLTQPHNIVQCQRVTSTDPWAPGQYPLAAIDGASSTKWQPASPKKASMTIDLSHISFQPIIGITFNWGLAPPLRADVLLSNSSTFDGQGDHPTIYIPIENITISIAFNASDVTIKQYSGNTTSVGMVQSGGIWSGRYARLEIEGTQGEHNTTGATVAEFGMIGIGGSLMAKRFRPAQVYRSRPRV